MNVLHVVPTYAPAWRHGGPIFAVHGLAKTLAHLGHCVTVYTTDVHAGGCLAVPLDKVVEVEGVPVRYFPATIPSRYYRSPLMGRALRSSVCLFDIVHIHSLFLWPTSAAAKAARRADKPYLVAPRGMLVRDMVLRRGRWRKSAWLQFVGRRILSEAATIHVETRLEADEAIAFGVCLPPVSVVPNGIDTVEDGRGQVEQLPPTLQRSIGTEPYVLFLSRISWKKGLDRLITALSYCPGVRLVVVGNDEEGLQPGLKRLANECGVADRVTFVGALWGIEKEIVLRRASALVLPSQSENFGNVVLEAMAAGIPVVITPEVGLADEVLAAGAGLVVEGSPEALGLALAKLLVDPLQRAEMGERGRRVAREKYSWPAVARQMVAVYENAIMRHHRRQPKANRL